MSEVNPEMTAKTQFPTFRVFAPFEKVTKQDDGSLLVESVINDETVDDQGEIVTFEAVEKASAEYMNWANVREMHDPHTAAGTMLSLTSDPELRKHTGVIQVVDPEAIKKIEAGVYKGTSLGGMKTAFGGMTKSAGKLARQVTGILWNETSLVDRPSRPTAVLTLAKRSEEEVADALGDAAPPVEPDGEIDATLQPQAVQEPGEAAIAAGDEEAAHEAAEPTEPETAEKATGSVASAIAALAAADTGEGQPSTEPLTKSAVDDVMTLGGVINNLAILIETEAQQGDSEDVTKLRGILAELQSLQADEAEEIGTPEDLEQREEELEDAQPEIVAMYYASTIGDLAKHAIALRKGTAPADAAATRIQQLHDAAHLAGAACSATPAAPAEQPQDLAKAAGDPELLEKLTAHVARAIGPTVTPDDLEAMKGEIVKVIEPITSELAKIAAQPVAGGPLRYAADDRRGLVFDGSQPVGSSSLAEALTKASQLTGDPHVREELGRLAAAEEIAAMSRVAHGQS